MPNLREIYQVSGLKFYKLEIRSRNYITAVYIGTSPLGLGVAMKFRRNDFLKEVSFPNLKISHNSILLYRNGNLTTDADFCKKMTDGRKRMTLLGLDSEYDCSGLKLNKNGINELGCFRSLPMRRLETSARTSIHPSYFVF